MPRSITLNGGGRQTSARKSVMRAHLVTFKGRVVLPVVLVAPNARGGLVYVLGMARHVGELLGGLCEEQCPCFVQRQCCGGRGLVKEIVANLFNSLDDIDSDKREVTSRFTLALLRSSGPNPSSPGV